jgi:hypothetical protein
MRTRPDERSVHSLKRRWNRFVCADAEATVLRMSGLMGVAIHAG